MLSYTVNVPDEKEVFFEELINSLGFASQKQAVDEPLSEETKKMLDERLESYYQNPNEISDFKDTIQKVRAKLLA